MSDTERARSTSPDRVAIVTGANRGIGKETALELTRMGMTVIMACRNLESAETARSEIVSLTGNQNVHVLALDLSSQASIHAFACEFRSRFSKLNILINNAGICTMSHTMTPDGFESHIGTNFMGTFLLTTLLLPMFEEGADDRIINVVSNIYRIGWFNPGKINNYRWFRAYAVSKNMVLLFTLELADRLRDSGITVNAVHPGIVRTSIMYTGRWFDFLIKAILSPFFIDIAQGAETSIYAATSGEAENLTGRYFAHTKAQHIPTVYDNAMKRRIVWDLGQRYLGAH